MGKKSSLPKCALINAPCPKTADETAPVYCPNWVENVPEVVKDGSGRVTAEVFYTGCQLRRQVLYQLSMTASAGQAAASADKSATQSNECRTAVIELANFAIRSAAHSMLLEPAHIPELPELPEVNDVSDMGR